MFISNLLAGFELTDVIMSFLHALGLNLLRYSVVILHLLCVSVTRRRQIKVRRLEGAQI